MAADGLRWAATPRVYRQGSAPDRVLQGEVRNDGPQRVDLVAADLRLLDADGRRVPGVATFALGFLHSLYPPTREPRLSDREQRRLGRRAFIEPGKQVQLTLAWRQKPGTRPPVSVSYGRGMLPIPPSR